MHQNQEGAIERAHRAYRDRLLPALHKGRVPLTVTAWQVPGEPVPYAEAAARAAYEPVQPGDPWGPPWGTTWFHLAGAVPADWASGRTVEAVIDLGFTAAQAGFQAEGLAWSDTGQPLKGVSPRNQAVPLGLLPPGSPVNLLVEAASNPDIGSDWQWHPTPMGDLATAGREPLYRFGGAWLLPIEPAVRALERDWFTLLDLVATLDQADPRRAQIVAALNLATDRLGDLTSADVAAAAEALAPVLQPNAPAAASAHRVIAAGHAHIDSAWFWPIRETRRKCARTFANVLTLMDQDPDFVFAASSAQQYAWVKADYPALYARIKARVAEGRWIPVGGMWVESDNTMPGGEALVRQFVEGTAFFETEFGLHPTVGWLPDCFGYTAALPQILRGAGLDTFVTQKLSWNDTNKMPHSTFHWVGLDGSSVIMHFPPMDNYNSDLGAADLDRAARQNREAGLLDASLALFGYGDGGGGPTLDMVEVGRRKTDLDGSPRVQFGRPEAFFDQARLVAGQLPTWWGELYLEFHRGTFTSQAGTKAGNRRCEHLLREAELWAATAAVRAGFDYPAADLRECWQIVLLHQFHDILPGSSIAWVHREAQATLADVAARLERIIEAALAALAALAPVPDGAPTVAFNASPFTVAGVPPLAAGSEVAAPAGEFIEPHYQAGGPRQFYLLADGQRATFDGAGALISLKGPGGRELIPHGQAAGVPQVFEDRPNRWDAWDIDLAYQRTPVPVTPVSAELGPDGRLEAVYTVGASRITQRWNLAEGGLDLETEVDWHEHQRLLKLAFPVALQADRAAYEIQFGHVWRSTLANTPWEAAQFEVFGHRWVRVEDPAGGLTVANDRVYGHDVKLQAPDPKAGPGGVTLLRETLLRAATFPDPNADQGRFVFHHRLVAGGRLDGIAAGYAVNLPLRRRSGAPVAPLVTLTGDDGVLVETVKLAHDGSGDVVVRLYEALGRPAAARLEPGFAVAGAQRTDLLERALPEQPPRPLELDLGPFQIATLRLQRG
ncbi:MAG: glycosyl hydrolase-related protein [Bifidobacteriaceae bacterium]|nr:glycosyl hydrolase-related protein [Bifidobacteriaceae bacterium]